MNNNTPKTIPRRGEFTGKIVHLSPFGTESYAIKIELTGTAAAVYSNANAGQFIQIACRDLNETDARACQPLLRRPLSLAGVCNRSENNELVEIEFIVQVKGPGTSWLERRRIGEPINLIGPLGNGFRLMDNESRIIIMGGGVGLPPMFFLADQMSQTYVNKDLKVISFAGIRSRAQFDPLMIQSRFHTHGFECIISTDDGTYGHHGTAVEAMAYFIENHPEWLDAQVFACGPDGMLKSLSKMTLEKDMPCQICMEAYMACGIGLCQSCVVPVHQNSENTPKNEENEPVLYKLVCTNGPVFDARSIAWEDYK